jgi:uncharacterized protein (DUF2062 family)
MAIKLTGLLHLNDTPQRVALGLGIGVFSGIMPGMGILVAIFLAVIVKANRASAIIGSLLTNTWFSILTFILAAKIGSFALNIDWQEVHNQSKAVIKHFHWQDLFKLSFIKILFPVIVGYLILGLVCGLISYLVALVLIKSCQKKVNPQERQSP